MEPDVERPRPGSRRSGSVVFYAGIAALVALICGVGIFALRDGGAGSPFDQTPVIVTGRSATVTVDSLDFDPRNLHVERGATVTWEFSDDLPHNVKAAGAAFESDTFTEGAFSYTFDDVGEHRYVCTIHPNMTAVVVVGSEED